MKKNSTCLGHIYCPSLKNVSMTNTYFCVYNVETPDDGQWFFIKINLINSASRCLLL
jgi:hypothetical protein